MFGDLNQVELIGNVTNDINLKYTPNGRAVGNFSIATNRRYKNQTTDQWQDEASFHNIVVWGNDAEGMSQRAKKGTRVFIQGRLQTRSWDDQDGKKNYRTEVVADKIILLDRYERGQMESLSGGNNSSKPMPAKSTKSNEQIEEVDNGEINPDDLPF
jgi:single-strand DNA-binding protein